MQAHGRLQDRVVVITGGGSGFGRAAAVMFAGEGARVYVVDRDGDAVDETLEVIGAAAVGCRADVTSSSDMEALSRQVVAEQGRVDVVFANAGIEGVGRAGDLAEDAWQRVIDVNLKGVWLTSKFFLEHMVAAGRGSIINTASIGALVGVTGIMPYAAAKGGVLAMSRQMATDYAQHGIRVNAICPGTVVTPLVERSWRGKGQDVETETARVAARHPLGRAGAPDDIASAALYLASDDSSWVTGQAITVDGGFTMV